MHLTRFFEATIVLSVSLCPIMFYLFLVKLSTDAKVFIDNLRGISISCDMAINEPGLKYIFMDGRDISGFVLRSFSTFGFI